MTQTQNPDEILAPESSVVRAIEGGQYDTAIATAKRYPRNIKRSFEAALGMATLSQDVAAECRYILPARGDSGVIEGGSVRLAEIVACTYGNLNIGSRIVDITDTQILIQGVGHDLETNVRVNVQVVRSILNRNKRRYSPDMIRIACEAGLAIAYRKAVFAIVPRAHWQPILDKAKKVAAGNAVSLRARREDVLHRLRKNWGISTERVLLAMDLDSIEAIGIEELGDLIALGKAVNEGVTDVEAAFPLVTPLPAKSTPAPKPKSKKEPGNGDAVEAGVDLDSIVGESTD